MATPNTLRKLVDLDFEPGKETRDEWQARVMRIGNQLARMGQPLTEEEMEKVVRKGKYVETIHKMSEKEQKDWLKTEFGRILLCEDYGDVEYRARLQALMDLLRSRGTEVDATGRLFSQGASAPKPSLEASPDKSKVRIDDGLGQSSGGTEDTLVMAIKAQTDALTQVLKSKDQHRASVVKKKNCS